MAGDETRSSIFENRFLHPYYVFNGALCVAFIGLRLKHYSPKELAAEDMFGITREQQIYFCLVLMLFTRILSAPTIDAYLSSAFMFARVTILLCLWYMNTRLAIFFFALWCLIYAVFPQPRYRLPSSITTLNSASFDDRITRNKHRTIYVVWLHATWSARCSQLSPILASLAKSYSHPRLRFARLDVSKFPATAEKLGVSVSAASKELPAIICFNQGKEVARIPITDARGNIPKQWIRGFTATQVAEQLDLNKEYNTAKQWEKESQDRYKQLQKNKKSS